MLCRGRLWEFLVPVALMCHLPATNGQERAGIATGALRTKPAVVLVVGGVGGMENLKCSMEWALEHAGVASEVREFRWTHGKGHIFMDLQDTRNHARRTDELVEDIRQQRMAEPERPIFLVGRSGGAILTLAATEQLPPQTLERIILLSPAVSPSFDLRAALRACRGEVVSFNSNLDWLILGWGTNHFGTADRYYCASAGKTGFIRPSEDDAETQELYRRLVQVRWTPTMILYGHTGGHLGTAMPTFLAREVAPWLKP